MKLEKGRTTLQIVLVCLLLILFNGCKEDQTLKEKELDLKKRELDIREKELSQKKSDEDTKSNNTETPKTKKRKLRYLSYQNSGLVGYFSDGTIAGCPRCDLMKENIKALYDIKPHDTYTVNKDGSILRNKGEREQPKKGDGWAMINYEWLEEVKE